MKNKITLIVLSTLTLLCGSCSEFFDTPEHMKGRAWGLRSVEYKQPMLFDVISTEIEIPYKARVNSKRYELRMYFPSNKTFRNDSVFKIQQNELLEALKGLEAQIIDESGKEVLEYLTIGLQKDMSFNRTPEAPLSLWLFSSVQLTKDRNYKIRIQVPPVREYKKEHHDVILILGIGSTPML